MKGGNTMAKKQIITNTEIEKDIVHSLKHPAGTPICSERSFGSKIKDVILLLIIGCLAVFADNPMLWISLVFIVWLIGIAVSHYFRVKKQKDNLSGDDYTVTTETVQNTEIKRYTEWQAKPIRRKEITNCILHFENGKSWCIPKENYPWSKETMSDSAIFQSTHQGDRFIVVTAKESGEILMGYHTVFFEYKE